MIWRHELRKFLIFFNNQHPNIHFTIDIEANEKLSFLDILVFKKTDVTLGHQVYRKPTHTDRYLDAESHHHSAQTQSAINSLVHRAFTISDKEHLQTEFNHLKTALQKNGHDKKDVIKIINKHANKTTVSDKQSNERILSILSYVKGTIERIVRILNKHNIFKSPKKLRQI